MKNDLLNLRLANQHITTAKYKKPEQLVSWLGAVQAQDFAGAKWALGLRLRGVTDEQIEKLFSTGKILRTHVMRPTWHFVSPADIHWLLDLTAARIRQTCATAYRSYQLDSATISRANDAIIKAVEGGRQLTRNRIGEVLLQAGIETNSLRLAHIMMRAELDKVVCSGAREGNQFTYALLDERAIAGKKYSREESLAMLAGCYFKSHAPATLSDFAWWSGLTYADAKAGFEMVKNNFKTTGDDKKKFILPRKPIAKSKPRGVLLLPNYDEYTVSYKDRSEMFDSRHAAKISRGGNLLFSNTVVIDGMVCGTWQRTIKKDYVDVDVSMFTRISKTHEKEIVKTAACYATFLNKELGKTAIKLFS